MRDVWTQLGSAPLSYSFLIVVVRHRTWLAVIAKLDELRRFRVRVRANKGTEDWDGGSHDGGSWFGSAKDEEVDGCGYGRLVPDLT